MSLGGGGTQTTTQEFKPPGYTQPYWEKYVAAGDALKNVPYQQSGLPTVAPMNDMQNTAMQLAYDRALYGAPDVNAGRGAAMNAANGNYANPYAQNVSGIAAGDAYNPWSEGVYNLAGQSNPYMSDEYTNQIINNNADQMAKAYSVGGAVQNDAAANMAGAYGGSAHQEMKDRGESSLANQIGQMASTVQQQQQQYKGNMYNADYANKMGALGLGGQMYNSDVANQLGANAQAGGMWNNDINNILSGSALTFQGSQDDYKSTDGLMQAGNNWNSYYQKLLDSYNNQWNTESMYDANMNEYLGSVLGRASGSWGSTATSQPGQNTLAGLLGAGATAAGMYSLYK
jgi:hypothetical protein